MGYTRAATFNGKSDDSRELPAPRQATMSEETRNAGSRIFKNVASSDPIYDVKRAQAAVADCSLSARRTPLYPFVIKLTKTAHWWLRKAASPKKQGVFFAL